MQFLEYPPRFVFFTGKGGVGKTTLAAAVAVALARRGLPVHLTTSDPAAHLTEPLSEALDNLSVSRIDPHLETERYRQHVLQRGVNEWREIDRVASMHARRYAVVPLLRNEPVGIENLLALSHVQEELA